MQCEVVAVPAPPAAAADPAADSQHPQQQQDVVKKSVILATSAYLSGAGGRKMTRRDVRLRRSQASVYNFLERPKDWAAISYHLLV
jgi:hypothetical protein